MKVKLIKVTSNHQNLRDDVIEGEAEFLPKVGERFFMTAPPRDSGNIRVLETSPVTEVTRTDEDTYEFSTRNSRYDLIILY
jgi:hypothetical protein